MVDSQIRRAPNAAPTFVESKIKFTCNETMKWVKDQTDNVLDYAIGRARRLKAEKDARQKRTTEEIAKRLREKMHKRDLTRSNKLEKEVKKLMNELKEDDPEPETLGQLSNQADRTLAVSMIINPAVCVGTDISHVWYDKETAAETVYNGHVRKVKKKRQKLQFVISYWKESETVDGQEDTDIDVSSFVTDFILGELVVIK